MALALRLCKGDYTRLKDILEMDSETFLTALQYDIFCNQYEEKYFENLK